MAKIERKLWGHQLEAVNQAKGKSYFALFFEPGCGKTATLISILRDIFNSNKKILTTFIFCPPVVIENWKNELLMWSKVPGGKVITLTGSGKDRARLLDEHGPGTIYITNYEALNMPLVFEKCMHLASKNEVILALDEGHKIKDIKSKRTKRALELSILSKYRYILTGTPILNNLMDVFSQFKFLDQGERFGGNFFTFRYKFFEDKNAFMPSHKHFPNWQAKPGADKEIQNLISDCSMFIEKKSCLTLPPFVRKTIEVPLGKDQAKLYQDMKQDLIATMELDSGDRVHSVAELAITKALRLQQICSGHLKFEDDEREGVIKIKDNPRKKALKELLEDLAPSHKVLVWAVFHANYEDIREVCSELKLEYAELHGLVKDKDAQVEKFRSSEKCRVLIGHPGSGGIGVNLVEASYMIYYSRSFSLEYDIQSEARAYRGGSDIHESITRIDLVTPNTIDELVLKALAEKQKLSESVLKQNLASI